jgi:hypothetical protein
MWLVAAMLEGTELDHKQPVKVLEKKNDAKARSSEDKLSKSA